MTMRQNKTGFVLMMLGAALMASALLLFCWNRAEAAELTVVEVSGYEYIGYEYIGYVSKSKL